MATRQQIEAQNQKDRVWDSLDYSYGKKKEDVGKQYDKAVSETDRQALGRGMQRSSYNAQTQANLRKEGAKAIADIDSEMAADYANRLYQIDRDAAQDQLQREQIAAQIQSAQISANASKYAADANRELAYAQLASEEARYYKGLEHETESQDKSIASQEKMQAASIASQEGMQAASIASQEGMQAASIASSEKMHGEELELEKLKQWWEQQMGAAQTEQGWAKIGLEKESLDLEKLKQWWDQQMGTAQTEQGWASLGLDEKKLAIDSASTILQDALANGRTPPAQVLAVFGLTPEDWAAYMGSLGGDGGGGGGGGSSSSGSRSSGKKTTNTNTNNNNNNTNLNFGNVANAFGQAAGGVAGTVGGFVDKAKKAIGNLLK